MKVEIIDEELYPYYVVTKSDDAIKNKNHSRTFIIPDELYERYERIEVEFQKMQDELGDILWHRDFDKGSECTC